MKNTLITVLKDGLHGKNTHIDPQKALKNLTADTARKKIKNGNHSCWDLLHHVVVWQEAILDSIKGNKVDWKRISETKNWPSEIEMQDDVNFEALKTKFSQKIEETENLIETIDLQTPISAWNNEPAIRAFLVLVQHNSYHFGNLVAIRKELNDWPADLKY